MKFNIVDIEHRQLASQSEAFSLSAVLSDMLGFKDIFVHHEIIQPGRRASSAHFHSHREEMVFVLSGSPTAYKGDTQTILQPGDFVGFLPERKDIHFIRSDTQSDVKLLVICSNPSQDEVIYAPICASAL